MLLLQSILEQMLCFLPMALGIYISYSVLKRPDLTVDGSFVLGACVSAKLLILKMPLVLVLVSTIGAGALCGALTALLQRNDRIPSLIAGIVVLFVLQSFNLIFLGRPNISLLDQTTLFSYLSPLMGQLLVVGGIAFALILFFQSQKGLFLRAFGCNNELLMRLGKSKEGYRLLGFMISNALVALSGSLTAQLNGYVDISMGTGVVISGLAAVLMGLQIRKLLGTFSENTILADLIGVAFGSFVYFCVVFYLSSMGINPLYLKLVIGITLGLILMSQKKQPKHLKVAI